MTPTQFEDVLIQTKAQLLDAFHDINSIKDLDIYVKTILDYQEIVAKTMFKELNKIYEDINKIRGDLLRDNRERFEDLMQELKKK
jgi:hypothetical protein